ncbi:c-type cytochrome [Palleronia sp. KMU-117]|uniref:c-type cytochrome n=1 Tax=Palleronia sp. KMU-117 TaxID=3434108 RepID=UPI003D73CA02
MRHLVFGSLALCLAALPAMADDAGQAAFGQYCATCHGADAKGAGPLGQLISIPIPDLTQLNARNDGVFPMLDVIHVIDGRTGVRAHEQPMPVYGAVFKSRLSEIGPYAAEIAVRGEVLSIAYYLESIQE